MSSARILTTLANEDHAESIAAFYREVWDPAATAGSVLEATRREAAENVAEPGKPPPTAVVLAGERVVGYCGSIPQRLWDGTVERPAYWLKGLMVLPEYRNGPIGYLAAKELSRHLDCSTILAAAPPALRLFSALGYSDLGAVPNWIRPLRAGTIAKRIDLHAAGAGKLPGVFTAGIRIARDLGVIGIAANTAGLAIDAVARITRLPAGNLVPTEDHPPSDAELNELWVNARGGMGATPVRDSTYLRKRFLAGQPYGASDDPYTIVTIRDRGQLVGFAAVRRPATISDARLGGIRMATASEINFPPARDDIGLALLGGIERITRDADADAVTCMTAHPSLSRLLRRQGYLRLAGNVHFLLRNVTAPAHWPAELGRWWLARGDGESDSSF